MDWTGVESKAERQRKRVVGIPVYMSSGQGTRLIAVACRMRDRAGSTDAERNGTPRRFSIAVATSHRHVWLCLVLCHLHPSIPSNRRPRSQKVPDSPGRVIARASDAEAPQ